MDFETIRYEKYDVIRFLHASFDNAALLEHGIALLKDKDNLIVDFENITVLQEDTLASFVPLAAACRAKNGLFIVCNADDKAKQVIAEKELAASVLVLERFEEACDYVLFHELEKDLGI